MLCMKCFVFRNKTGHLYLSIIKPVKTNAGNLTVRYPRSHPIHLRKNLLFDISSSNQDLIQGTRRIRVDDKYFPEVNQGEIKEVILSILDSNPLQEYCKNLDIPEEIVIGDRKTMQQK